MPAPRTMDYQIDKGIPMPKKRGHFRLYPFDRMEVGDSFLVKLKPTESLNGVQARVMAAAKKYGDTKGQKFACRSVSKNEFRIWRIV